MLTITHRLFKRAIIINSHGSKSPHGICAEDNQYHTITEIKGLLENLQKNKNINETMADLALLASVPFELLEEIREKKLSATLIRQINEDNDSFINYAFGICQLQISWDEKANHFIVTEPEIPKKTGSYQDEVNARQAAAEKSDIIFFLATRRREEGKVSIT